MSINASDQISNLLQHSGQHFREVSKTKKSMKIARSQLHCKSSSPENAKAQTFSLGPLLDWHGSPQQWNWWDGQPERMSQAAAHTEAWGMTQRPLWANTRRGCDTLQNARGWMCISPSAHRSMAAKLAQCFDPFWYSKLENSSPQTHSPIAKTSCASAMRKEIFNRKIKQVHCAMKLIHQYVWICLLKMFSHHVHLPIRFCQVT